MGVPTEDSPQYTVLSKVSTAAPSTQGSLDTIATESRHAVKARQSQVQLEGLGLNESSPAAAAEPEESAGAGGGEEEEAGPMDPPEEMSQDSNRDGEKRGVDPEEREHYLEPEDEEEGENQDDNVSAKPSAKSAASGAMDALENSLEEEPKTPGGSNLRRSRRARFKPLQFLKNKKLLYEAQNEQGMLGEAMGDMSVVAGVMHALPTPYKEVKRKETENNHNKKGKKRGRGGSDEEDSDGDTKRTKSPFDDKVLRKKYRIHNGESGSVCSETLESATDIKLVSRLDNRPFSELPLSSTRKKRESKVVGFASQAFHVSTDDDDLFPGYISSIQIE